MTFDNWEGYCTSCTHFIDWHLKAPVVSTVWPEVFTFRCMADGCGCEITRAAANRMRTDALVAHLVERLSPDEDENTDEVGG